MCNTERACDMKHKHCGLDVQKKSDARLEVVLGERMSHPHEVVLVVLVVICALKDTQLSRAER